MWEEELDCRYDHRKSFYGKAHVQHYEDGSLALRSYDTIVAVIHNGEAIRTWGGYSDTTRRHVNEFFEQYGYRRYEGKKAWDSMPSYYEKRWKDMTPDERNEAIIEAITTHQSEEEQAFWAKVA